MYLCTRLSKTSQLPIEGTETDDDHTEVAGGQVHV